MMATMSDDFTETPASIAMDAAIEVAIGEDRMLYPNGSLFVNAETTDLATVLARAADDGQTVVLCYRDGTRRIVEARSAPDAA
jgi:hypothetical protein